MKNVFSFSRAFRLIALFFIGFTLNCHATYIKYLNKPGSAVLTTHLFSTHLSASDRLMAVLFDDDASDQKPDGQLLSQVADHFNNPQSPYFTKNVTASPITFLVVNMANVSQQFEETIKSMDKRPFSSFPLLRLYRKGVVTHGDITHFNSAQEVISLLTQVATSPAPQPQP